MKESFLLYLLEPILGNKTVLEPQLQNSKKQFELFKWEFVIGYFVT